MVDPKPDYIIVFDPQLVPKPRTGKHPSSSSHPEKPDKAQTQAALQTEYESLIAAIGASGLEVTGRPGAKGTQQILLFVRANEDRLQAEVHRERLSDWLHGVASKRASPKTSRDFASEPITPAERLRLVYSILSSPEAAITGVSVTSSASSGRTVGLDPVPSPANFPHVVSVFPPHDVDFNQRWLKSWSSRSHALKPIPRAELDEIKDHLGEKIALYFAFLRYYFASLLYPALMGMSFYLLGLSYHPIYSIGMVGWSIHFIETWRIQEKTLSVDWGTYNIHTVESERAEFHGDTQIVDPVTGVEHAYFPFWKTFARQLMTIPVLLAFASVLVALISTIYVTETLFGEVYEGPAKRYLTLVPTIMFAGLVPQVIALWGTTAQRLTKFENHTHQTEHDQSLTLKTFALNFFVAYGSLVLTSYVYIPFGSVLVPYILGVLPSKHAEKLSSTSVMSPNGKKDFSINSSKLHTQIVAYTLTNQVVGAFTEIGLPFVLSFAEKEVAKVQEKRAGANSPSHLKRGMDDLSEHEYLERIRDESQLPLYDVLGDYAEMVLQFGYQALFSVIWPIAPLFAYLNNFIELRSDAFKITHQHRRPIPTRVATIGPWLDVLSFISYLAAFTNSSLVYLYRPHCDVSSPTRAFLSSLWSRGNDTLAANTTHIHATSNMHLATRGDPGGFFKAVLNGTNAVQATKEALGGGLSSTPSNLPLITSTLFSALLVSLFSEHIYLVVRTTVRFILHRTSWIGSEAANRVRRSGLELRRNYLDELGLKKTPKELAEDSGRISRTKDTAEKEKMAEDTKRNEREGFWKGQDKGLIELKRVAKID
ncbi:BZ3500_MvSof-1268-A1-R1_Chr2-2g04741 [Microbotryum saponariae]|uniref:BZ3500_MvSof-1268-A1-R1_Chr2-2g04741 protein n=1 Tax=Microbotryum saponariae TaxID=289078 RepID=A0A2X0L3M0_9BASI|nr:BZ3500_MvSof-1268-A1-R1_Chr2-2g04741 [Microbotryum saponariae]SDA00049.1 BZ3501_MvSof-1269-A2-R1_Chr2-2g04415 [Microbotryum saponariae]